VSMKIQNLFVKSKQSSNNPASCIDWPCIRRHCDHSKGRKLFSRWLNSSLL
jgi:hypothetical protein